MCISSTLLGWPCVGRGMVGSPNNHCGQPLILKGKGRKEAGAELWFQFCKDCRKRQDGCFCKKCFVLKDGAGSGIS